MKLAIMGVLSKLVDPEDSLLGHVGSKSTGALLLTGVAVRLDAKREGKGPE